MNVSLNAKSNCLSNRTGKRFDAIFEKFKMDDIDDRQENFFGIHMFFI